MKNILISNDDGVFAPGIFATKEALEDLADITVVAPSENNSGVGRHLSMFKHLNLSSCQLEDGFKAYHVSGTPSDSVAVGINYVMDKKPDLVVTGINTGVNISKCDITSSGTVCAAIEAVALGVPAIACSVFLDESSFKQDEKGNYFLDVDFSLAKRILHDLVEKVLDKGFPEGVDLLNLNIPSTCISDEIKITTLSEKMLIKKVIDSVDDDGNETIMLTPELIKEYDEGTDGYCLIVDKRPSLTPLNLDLTANIHALDNW